MAMRGEWSKEAGWWGGLKKVKTKRYCCILYIHSTQLMSGLQTVCTGFANSLSWLASGLGCLDNSLRWLAIRIALFRQTVADSFSSRMCVLWFSYPLIFPIPCFFQSHHLFPFLSTLFVFSVSLASQYILFSAWTWHFAILLVLECSCLPLIFFFLESLFLAFAHLFPSCWLFDFLLCP